MSIVKFKKTAKEIAPLRNVTNVNYQFVVNAWQTFVVIVSKLYPSNFETVGFMDSFAIFYEFQKFECFGFI